MGKCTDIDASLPDLKLLPMFDLLHGSQSVNRTAEQLGRKQPKISIWLTSSSRRRR